MTPTAPRPSASFDRAARAVAAVLAVLAATVSAACFSSETVIRVKADGSGTIEQVNLANKEMLGMAAGMVKEAVKNRGSADQVPSLDNIGDLFDETKIREQAASWGEGVRYVSSTPITEGGLSGVKAVFAFDDIRLVTTSNGREGAAGAPGPRLRFELDRPTAEGASSTVRVRMPEPPARPADAAPAAEPAAPPVSAKDLPPEALAMVRNMFKGARVSIGVEVEGAIVTTDAPKRDGSKVTIFALDLDQLLSDPSKFGALQQMKPGTDFATARKALDGVPGVVLPQTPTVSIEFR